MVKRTETPENSMLSIRISAEIRVQLERLARQKCLPVTALARMFLVERINECIEEEERDWRE